MKNISLKTKLGVTDVIFTTGLFCLLILLILHAPQIRPKGGERQVAPAETFQIIFPMNPPQVEMMSEWSISRSLERKDWIRFYRYVKVDGRLAIEAIQTDGFCSLTFVPPDCGESKKIGNGNG